MFTEVNKMDDMDEALEYARRKLQIKFHLKPKQIESLSALYSGNDCISILPTGYGKSLIYQLLPWFLQKEFARPRMVIVVTPLSSIMQDQVMCLTKKGIRAVYLNIDGEKGHTFKLKEDKDIISDSELVGTDLKTIIQGEFEILYCHPEALFNPAMSKILRSQLYQELVCCIAVDEVHMIEEWGEEFRPKFRMLGELTCLFPNAAHLAVTATATSASIKTLSKTLQYIDPVIIKVNPDRPNIFIEVKARLSNLKKYDKYDDIIKPICSELKTKLSSFPVTVLYVESLEALGYFYQYIHYDLGSAQYLGEEIPENRIFGQVHKDYTLDMKHHIISQLKKDSPKICLVLATVALGMGLDAPSIDRVIHCRPPTSLEKYLQEIGRAGRKGQKAIALMYYNNNDLAKNRKGLSEEMVAFCRDKESCLRLRLLRHFGFTDAEFQGPPNECCSNCCSRN